MIQQLKSGRAAPCCSLQGRGLHLADSDGERRRRPGPRVFGPRAELPARLRSCAGLRRMHPASSTPAAPSRKLPVPQAACSAAAAQPPLPARLALLPCQAAKAKQPQKAREIFEAMASAGVQVSTARFRSCGWRGGAAGGHGAMQQHLATCRPRPSTPAFHNLAPCSPTPLATQRSFRRWRARGAGRWGLRCGTEAAGQTPAACSCRRRRLPVPVLLGIAGQIGNNKNNKTQRNLPCPAGGGGVFCRAAAPRGARPRARPKHRHLRLPDLGCVSGCGAAALWLRQAGRLGKRHRKGAAGGAAAAAAGARLAAAAGRAHQPAPH